MGVGFYTIPPEKPVGPVEALAVSPPPPAIPPADPEPWIVVTIPPVEEVMPPKPKPPIVVVQPVEVPPIIAPPPPDLTPPTIVPVVFEEPFPAPLPLPPVGAPPVVQPPATIVAAGGLQPLGTFMVYVAGRLVLTMAAALGTSLGKSAGAMLVGAVSKQLFRGTTLRFHTGNAFGNFTPGLTETESKSVSYEQAWRMVPQEFSYWEK